MKRAAICVLMSCCGIATAQDTWKPVAATAASSWSIRHATRVVVSSRHLISAEAKRESAGKATEYRVSVLAEHCTALRGEVMLTGPGGHAELVAYATSDNTAAAHIAAALCKESPR